MRGWLAVHLFWLVMPAHACGPDWPNRVAVDDEFTLVYQTRPSPIEIARPFTLRFQFCRADQVIEVSRLKLDASMPAHGHGMNYQPSIEPLSESEFEAVGLLFHMPGAWQIAFDYDLGGNRRQLLLDIDL